MSDIKRYDCVQFQSGKRGMWPESDGRYVTYKDHVEVIHQAKHRIDTLVYRLQRTIVSHENAGAMWIDPDHLRRILGDDEPPLGITLAELDTERELSDE